MTLQELLKKNAEIEAKRALEDAKQNKKPVSKEEKVTKIAEEIVEEGKKENEEAAVEEPKKKGKKPANREYMVVEDQPSAASEVDF